MTFVDGGYDSGDEEQARCIRGAAHAETRTPLDRTIDRIGMGRYQWTLLALCGFGWLADNMWIQAVAIVLPRVQRQFAVPDTYIGALSASMNAGMMLGAVGWGACADLVGRTPAFNATLLLTALFGVLAAAAHTFAALCLALFLLGSAVGGSMPTDGTLLLEHLPKGREHLVTALSVFFSLGAVLAAAVGLAVVPSRSCAPLPAPCDTATQNRGWAHLLATLGLVTLALFVARIVLFRLHESPRYLVHAGRHREAADTLQRIARFNGEELVVSLEDVQDQCEQQGLHAEDDSGAEDVLGSGSTYPSPMPRGTSLDADQSPPRSPSRSALRSSGDSTPPDYSSTGTARALPESVSLVSATDVGGEEDYYKGTPRAHTPSTLYTPHSERRRMSRAPSLEETKARYWRLPRRVRRPLGAWADRLALVLAPDWMRTTLLVWTVWTLMSLAYTMFSVYLPTLLEGRGGSGGGARSVADSLWDVVVYAVGGCPGAILGAHLVDSRLGRRGSLAASTFVTALFCAVFVVAQQPWAVRASTVGISLSVTTMWAVLYGWTPEIFGTEVRGTACGIASALSRIGGMVAPMLGGGLLMVDRAFPVLASMGIFLAAGLCVLLLKENAGKHGAPRALVH